MDVVLLEKLDLLRHDLQRGQARLDSLDRERGELRDTLLRISGAIQVLEEVRSAAVPVPQVQEA